MSTELNLPSADSAFGQMNEVYNEAAIARREILNKVMSFVKDVDIKPATSPRDVEVRLGILKTADDILKSIEGNQLAIVKIAQQRKESDNNLAVGERMADMLRMIDMRQPPTRIAVVQDPNLLVNQLQDIYSVECVAINDAELVLLTEAQPLPTLEEKKEDEED